ncbi:MAG: PASTA domain-containing protein, partial [Candidatus Hydrogenedens sp.]
GVRLYDVANTGEINAQTKPLDLELEDGQLCVTGGCIHGDADNNKVVEKADAQYILSYWVKKVAGNECIMKSGDINLDGLVDSADSSLIQRWLAGKNITPPKQKELMKSYDEYLKDVLWLADAGSLSAEAILAEIEKSDVSVNVWLSEALTGEPGTQKTISVLADNVANISGFAMVLNFDKDLAQVDSVELGSSASGLELVYNDDVNSSGSLRISAAGEENIGTKGDGVVLVNIQFTMKGDGGNADLVLAQVRINDIYAHVPMFNDPKAPKILKQEPTPEGEGTPEGTPEGVVEGTPEGTSEGLVEGTPEGAHEGVVEGTPEGSPEGTIEGEGETPSNKVTVPDVVGKTEAEARSLITSAGLIVGTITQEYSDKVPKGKVIRQAPTAGSQVDRGSAVNLVISKGAKRRFIVSCGSGSSTNSSHVGDMLTLGLVSGLLLLRWRKVADFMKN